MPGLLTTNKFTGTPVLQYQNVKSKPTEGQCFTTLPSTPTFLYTALLHSINFKNNILSFRSNRLWKDNHPFDDIEMSGYILENVRSFHMVCCRWFMCIWVCVFVSVHVHTYTWERERRRRKCVYLGFILAEAVPVLLSIGLYDLCEWAWWQWLPCLDNHNKLF